MKIALVCHPYHRGGVTSWMTDFFNYGVKQNLNISFVTLEPKSPFISAMDRPKMIDKLDQKGIIFKQEVDYKFELGLRNYKINIYRNLILNNIPKSSILIPSDDEIIWAACASLAGNYVFCGVLHSDDNYYYNLYDKYKKFTAAIVSVSSRIQQKLSLPQHSFVIPCGIPLDKFDYKKPKKNKIAWIGRLEEHQKRASDIIPIANKILEKYPDWHFYIVGNGAESEKIQAQIRNLNLDTSIHLVGWKESHFISNLLSESRVLLQTSNFEGMSVAMMEALGSGCQILSTQVSGVEDLITKISAKGVVEIYPIGDIESAFYAFEKLVKHDEENLAKKAFNLANDEFSIQACYDSYCKAIKNLTPTKNMDLNKRPQIFSTLIASMRKLKYKIYN